MSIHSSQTLPPGQQLVADGKWPIIGERQPAATGQAWSLRVSGEVSKPTTLSLAQLTGQSQTTLIVDIHCVTRWSKLGVEFSGVSLSDLLTQVVPFAEAKFVSFVSRSDRRHSSSMPIEVALAQQTLIALAVEGQPLPIDHGGPIRNIVPGRYFYKSVKWVTEIQLLSDDRLGFWESESGYHNAADPWLEQRYLAPSLDRRTVASLIESRDFSHQNLLSLLAANRDLQHLKAHCAALRNADFSHSDLRQSDFSNANLSNANLRKSDLRNCNFTNADMEGADFTGADLRGANLTGCSLIGSSFFDAAQGVHSGAIFDADTILPESVIAPLFPEQLNFVQQSIRKLAQGG